MENKRNEGFLNPRFEERKAARARLPIQCGGDGSGGEGPEEK